LQTRKWEKEPVPSLEELLEAMFISVVETPVLESVRSDRVRASLKRNTIVQANGPPEEGQSGFFQPVMPSGVVKLRDLRPLGDREAQLQPELSEVGSLRRGMQDWSRHVAELGEKDPRMASACREFVRNRLLKAQLEGNLESCRWDKEPVPTLEDLIGVMFIAAVETPIWESVQSSTVLLVLRKNGVVQARGPPEEGDAGFFQPVMPSGVVKLSDIRLLGDDDKEPQELPPLPPPIWESAVLRTPVVGTGALRPSPSFVDGSVDEEGCSSKPPAEPGGGIPPQQSQPPQDTIDGEQIAEEHVLNPAASTVPEFSAASVDYAGGARAEFSSQGKITMYEDVDMRDFSSAFYLHRAPRTDSSSNNQMDLDHFGVWENFVGTGRYDLA
jgi:hypothetical protein